MIGPIGAALLIAVMYAKKDSFARGAALVFGWVFLMIYFVQVMFL